MGFLPAGLLTEVRDLSTGANEQVECIVAGGVDPQDAAAQLATLYGVTIVVAMELPLPLPALLRRWVADHDDATPVDLSHLLEISG